jgi:hypothetical protein
MLITDNREIGHWNKVSNSRGVTEVPVHNHEVVIR